MDKTTVLAEAVRHLFLILLLIVATGSQAHAEPSCAELNGLYQQRYIKDFSIDRSYFEFDKGDRFDCSGFDKNYIMARAFHDLDLLSPVNPDEPNYYADVSEVLRLVDNQLRYIPTLVHYPDAEARTYHEGALSAIFYTDRMIQSSERFRPTYTLIHEARHTIKFKPGIPDEPGHVICSRGRNRGKRVCDERLSKESDLVWGSGNSHEFLFLIYARDHPSTSSNIKKEIKNHLKYLSQNMFNQLEPGIVEYYE